MADFLTDQWFDVLRAKATTAAPSPSLRFTLEQIIDGNPQHRWQIQVADGTVRVARDATGEADVRIRTDEATASGIHAGEISAQRAFLDGRLQIGGDVQALMEHRETLAELGLGLA